MPLLEYALDSTQVSVVMLIQSVSGSPDWSQWQPEWD